MAAKPKAERGRKIPPHYVGGNRMASLANIQVGIDQLLAVFWPEFRAGQESYRTNPVLSPLGRYWQGLLWPATKPDDAVVVEPDDAETDAVAPDNSRSWRQMLQDAISNMVTPPIYWDEINEAIKPGSGKKPKVIWSMRCDQYNTPTDGVGFKLVVTFTKANKEYRKTLAHGPLALTDSEDWVELQTP